LRIHESCKGTDNDDDFLRGDFDVSGSPVIEKRIIEGESLPTAGGDVIHGIDARDDILTGLLLMFPETWHGKRRTEAFSCSCKPLGVYRTCRDARHSEVERD
jgi:hypothetical protein